MANTIDVFKSGILPRIVADYLRGENSIRSLYDEPNEAGSYRRLADKIEFDSEKRERLHRVISRQYEQCGITLEENSPCNKNLGALKDKLTFTITTGHQLCLFTGPLYFIYKIATAIKLSQQLNNQ